MLLLLLVVSASLLWLFVVLVVSVLLHELGHAVAAWTGGYCVTSLGIGTGKPLLLVRLPRTGTVFYVCRFGLHFSGITWVFAPGRTPSRVNDIFLTCGGALTNAVIAVGAACLLNSFGRQPVPFLTVWVPTVVVLLVNSVLSLLFFVPRRTRSAEQGTLASDGLQALVTLFPARFRRTYPGNSVAPLRTLRQKRDFWESIGDTTMLCAALIRASETYLELGDRERARTLWKEYSAREVIPGAVSYQRAWGLLHSVMLGDAADAATTLREAEEVFRATGNTSGVLRVSRERLLRRVPGSGNPVDCDSVLSALSALQLKATEYGDVSLSLSVLADRIDLLAASLLGGEVPETDSLSKLAALERLASNYDAARLEGESSAPDIRVYGQIARVRAGTGDDGGAAIAYERALSAARRVFVALALFPEAQSRFAARQTGLIILATDCCYRLGRTADAERYARLLR